MIPKDQLNQNYHWIGENEIKDIWSYLRSIDWTEGWLIGVLCFHVACLVAIVTTKRHSYLQYAIFLFLLCFVMVSEKINKFAAKHWRSFSRQQYFDSGGMFISLVFSTPMLINCVTLLVMWFCEAFRLLGKVKRQRVIAANDDGPAAMATQAADDKPKTD